jgi:hypothetical protein
VAYWIFTRFYAVGNFARREAEKLIVGYTFDLRTNTLKPKTIRNPAAGQEHQFVAYRLEDSPREGVAMRPAREVIAEDAAAAANDE